MNKYLCFFKILSLLFLSFEAVNADNYRANPLPDYGDSLYESQDEELKQEKAPEIGEQRDINASSTQIKPKREIPPARPKPIKPQMFQKDALERREQWLKSQCEKQELRRREQNQRDILLQPQREEQELKRQEQRQRELQFQAQREEQELKRQEQRQRELQFQAQREEQELKRQEQRQRELQFQAQREAEIDRNTLRRNREAVFNSLQRANSVSSDQSIKVNAYGAGLNADEYGRPHVYRTRDGRKLNTVKQEGVQRDGYGFGVHIDQYGRPVRDSQP
jgi:hypothetical protein